MPLLHRARCRSRRRPARAPIHAPGVALAVIVHGGEFGGKMGMTDWSAFLTTLNQGTLLNVILAIYMGLVALLIWSIRAFNGGEQV